LAVDDARVDPIFKSHPAVLDGTLVAYLGIPLMDRDDNAIGTLCVYDTKPRLWSTGHVQILSDLAEIASERIFGSGQAGQAEYCAISSIGDAMRIAGLLLLYRVLDQGVRRCRRSQVMWD
jgi:signal transduction protein with GAF and PtsI domain